VAEALPSAGVLDSATRLKTKPQVVHAVTDGRKTSPTIVHVAAEPKNASNPISVYVAVEPTRPPAVPVSVMVVRGDGQQD
jgi:hypothetical protein